MTRSADHPLVPYRGAPTPGTRLPQHHAGCFACGDGEGGLRLRFTAGEQLTMTGTFTPASHHQGSPGITHGGILAAVCDEALGALQTFFPEPAVTASLSTDFRRPVPVGTELHLRCRVDSREGRKLRVSGEARLGAPDGPVALVTAALFVFVEPEHFERHGRPEDVAAARASS